MIAAAFRRTVASISRTSTKPNDKGAHARPHARTPDRRPGRGPAPLGPGQRRRAETQQRATIAQLPTHSDPNLGNGNWGLGPSFVLFHMDRKSPWVYGFMVNNLWSLETGGHGGAYNHGVIQPGVNYNFKSGFYLTSSPVITVDWRASPGERWTVPVGGGIGKVFNLGPLPINVQLSGYYHVVAPEEAGDWEIRAQTQFLFPK